MDPTGVKYADTLENDHEPLADRHSSRRRIRHAYHVLIETTGPLRIQAAGTVR
jgi:hypothetical protein